MKFQIRLTDKKGFGSFLYFESDLKDKEAKACEMANEYLNKQRQNNHTWGAFSECYKPFKTIKVVEYDSHYHTAKRGGEKFKLVLSYIIFKLQNGERKTNEWYEFN